MKSLEYSFLTELIHTVQVIYSRVISNNNYPRFKMYVSENSKICFLRKRNKFPKQHYLIHVPELIKLTGPVIRSYSFSFEVAHQYFKQAPSKQNFNNLPLSLAERHQLLECSYFGDAPENFNSRLPLLSGRNFGMLQIVSEEIRNYLPNKYDELALLHGIDDLTGNHKTSYFISYKVL